MMEALATWILTLMTSLAPSTPWRATYPSTALAFAASAVEKPLFDGQHGAAKTAALYVSIAWYEATMRPDAEGDCGSKDGRTVPSVAGRCPADTIPRSFCIFQIGGSNLAGLGLTREEIQSDITTCVRAGNVMMRRSFTLCRARPIDDRLAWYAAGGPECGEKGSRESRHRMAKAAWLFRTEPPP